MCKSTIQLFRLVTLQDCSPPMAARPFGWLRAGQPTAAQLATNNKCVRTAAGSEESRSILLSSRLRLKVIYNEIAIFKRKPPKRGLYGS